MKNLRIHGLRQTASALILSVTLFLTTTAFALEDYVDENYDEFRGTTFYQYSALKTLLDQDNCVFFDILEDENLGVFLRMHIILNNDEFFGGTGLRIITKNDDEVMHRIYIPIGQFDPYTLVYNTEVKIEEANIAHEHYIICVHSKKPELSPLSKEDLQELFKHDDIQIRIEGTLKEMKPVFIRHGLRTLIWKYGELTGEEYPDPGIVDFMNEPWPL